MNFCGGSWYGVFVVNITGIEGGMAVEEDAAMFVSICQVASRPLSLCQKKIILKIEREKDHRAGIPRLLSN